VDIVRVREIAHACLSTLESSRTRLDDLNVYPVPDGDTGTNMTLTVRAVVEAADGSTARETKALGAELTRAALMGARGNSGVILSQLVRGFADGVGDAETVDRECLARAFRGASDAADRAVRAPVEGTILTVARDVAAEAELGGDDGEDIAAFLRRLLARGEASLARTPELLPVLREAGVVDAGGAGLVELIRGLVAGVTGEAIPAATTPGDVVTAAALHVEHSRFRYCTVFVVEGAELDPAALEDELGVLGDSLLVVGDPTALKVHVHTDEPGAALPVGTAVGTIAGVEIADMHRQAEERERRLEEELLAEPTVATGLVVVVAGAGNQQLFESYGAQQVIEGGQTMNPAASELVAAIDATCACDVLVLPNNPNVVLAAEQAVSLARRPARVVPSRSVQSGLAAVVRYVPTLGIEENERAMLEAIAGVCTGEVTIASRDVVLDGVTVRAGAWLGLVDDKALTCVDAFDDAACTVVDRLLADGRDVLTVLAGCDAPELDRFLDRVAAAHPRVEVDVFRGGQPHYPLLLSAE
jgi:DAK2 domain fusion protein YloV